jgi:hypothetical protein
MSSTATVATARPATFATFATEVSTSADGPSSKGSCWIALAVFNAAAGKLLQAYAARRTEMTGRTRTGFVASIWTEDKQRSGSMLMRSVTMFGLRRNEFAVACSADRPVATQIDKTGRHAAHIVP